MLDTLEILMYLARLDSVLYDYDNEQIKNHCAWNAARITGRETPTQEDVNIILAFIAGLETELCDIWRRD